MLNWCVKLVNCKTTLHESYSCSIDKKKEKKKNDITKSVVITII